MAAAQTPTGEWISQPRFDQAHGIAGLDHDFGMQWGPHQNQRISLRLAPGRSDGLLYVYDSLWNEYNVLNGSVSLTEARAAFDDVTRRFGYRGIGVDVFADAIRQRQLEPLLAASVEPRNLGALGIEL
jgi:hypothetical protein